MPILTFRSVIVKASDTGIALSGDTTTMCHGGSEELGKGSVGREGSSAEDL